jgi:hypothetical protein
MMTSIIRRVAREKSGVDMIMDRIVDAIRVPDGDQEMMTMITIGLILAHAIQIV